MSSSENFGDQKKEFVEVSEIERLKRDIYRSGKEKLQLFTAMLRQNAMLKKAIISHK